MDSSLACRDLTIRESPKTSEACFHTAFVAARPCAGIQKESRQRKECICLCVLVLGTAYFLNKLRECLKSESSPFSMFLGFRLVFRISVWLRLCVAFHPADCTSVSVYCLFFCFIPLTIAVYRNCQCKVNASYSNGHSVNIT